MKNWKYSLILITLVGTSFGMGYKYNEVLERKRYEREKAIIVEEVKSQVVTADYNFDKEPIELETETYEELVDRVAKECGVSPEVIIAIGQVESRSRNLVGDKHLSNRAYGYFQIRQPAVDEVNRIYGFQGIDTAEELLEDLEAQVRYCSLYINHLVDLTGSIDDAIRTYNIGYTNWKNGKRNDYLDKVKSFMN